ncbi:hypothetical protein OIO90_001722 [Microbotryomycetes sp. JL221]|nr:hypothetical protein OIO90_001722 [Microbotryomycetes sp. JL221]
MVDFRAKKSDAGSATDTLDEGAKDDEKQRAVLSSSSAEKSNKPSLITTKQKDSTGFTEEDWMLERQVLRRLDWIGLTFTDSQLNPSLPLLQSSGNARIAGLQADLGLTSHQYLIVITVTYVPYIASELPSNLLLKIVGPHILIPGLVVAWGLTTMCTGFVQSYGGLVAARFFLGLLEGGVFPGLVLYLSSFYRRRELQTRISLFFSAASLSGAFSGLLAAGIHSLFLNAAQKAHVQKRLALDVPPGAATEEQFSWLEVKRAFTSPHVLLLFVSLFGNGVTLYGLAYFTPSIVQTFRWSTTRTQLMTVPPYVAAFCVTMLNARLADKYGYRGACVIAMSLVSIVGYAIFIARPPEDRWARYGSLFPSIIGAYSTAPAVVTWLPANSARHYRRATAVAMGFIATNSGGILSTWLFPTEEAPSYKRATIVNLCMAGITGLFAVFNILYLMRQNKLKEARKTEATAESWNDEGDKHPAFRYSY